MIGEHIALSPSFAARSVLCHLCILPIVLFGTQQQRRTSASRELESRAYARNERSGSTALGAKARATKDQRQWGSRRKDVIPNGDLPYVTSSLPVVVITSGIHVEKAFRASAPARRHKWGCTGHHHPDPSAGAGSAENVLEDWQGHKVAFNRARIRPVKLARCPGGCKEQREAPSTRRSESVWQPMHIRPIKHKLGEMTARTTPQSLMYRTAASSTIARRDSALP